MKRSRAIDLELLVRKGVRDEVRREALADMAKLDKKPELKVLLEAINALDERRNEANDAVAFDLGRLLTSRDPAELATARPELEGFATAGQMPITRQLGYLALIAADKGVDKAWMLASKSAGSLRDLVDAMPAIRDPGQRLALYPKVLPLLTGLPKALGGGCLGVIKGDRGTIRADRAEGPSNADARRGRGLERRPECRAARQGNARRTRLTAASPSVRSTATIAESTATGARPTPARTPPTHGGSLTSAPSCRSNRSPSGTGPRRTSTSGSTPSPSRSSTPSATSFFMPTTCRRNARWPPSTSAETGWRGPSDARRWSR